MPEPTTPQLTESDVEAIEARANAATEGPWTAYHRISPRGAYKQWHVGNKDGLCQITMSGHERDYQFMAHARTDVPALIRDWRALTANLQAHREAMEAFKQVLDKREEENTVLRAQLAEAHANVESLSQTIFRNEHAVRMRSLCAEKVKKRLAVLEKQTSESGGISRACCEGRDAAIREIVSDLESLTLDQVEQETK